MAIAYVIHTGEDAAFVETAIAPALARLGVDSWVSSLTPRDPAGRVVLGDVTLVVVPASATFDARYREEIMTAIAGRAPVLVTYRDAREIADEAVAKALDGKPVVEDLANASWSGPIFSALLREAVNRHDYSRGNTLIRMLRDHLAASGTSYPSTEARNDLKTLRSKRQFLLMRRYAEAVLKSGTTDPQVQRQYGQALIELKELDDAIEVLTRLADETKGRTDKDGRNEHVEARGLLGRAHKQRYVDSGGKDGDEIEAAIEEYRGVFEEDRQNVWHGINAATCIIRCERDGVAKFEPNAGMTIAAAVLDVLNAREAKKASNDQRLDVWDYATRVEALVDIGHYDEAEKALGAYLVHPDMNAFEVSSTFRQFDEVLQLKDSKAHAIWARLAEAAERLRSGGITPMDDEGTRAMVLRVSDPSWAGETIPRLTIVARMGTVIAVRGFEETVQALLKDPVVISVQESRPGGEMECARSLPFINAPVYPAAPGTVCDFGKGTIVALIDDGIDVLHEAFLDDQKKSRIIGIWDQQDTAAPASTVVPFGRYYDADDIAAFVAKTVPVPAAWAQTGEGHGTHVASIAAGRRTAKFAGGVAPEAELLIVISGGDEPIGYSHTHLAALEFIGRVATKPVVVNVSQGMNAGAHDGLSPVEIAFDAFTTTGTMRGRAVVKSAGNERDKHGHARTSVAAGSAGKFQWRCPPGSPPVRMEIWWPGVNEFSFTLRSAAGEVSAALDRTNPKVSGRIKGQGPYEMQLVPNHEQNGMHLVTLTHGNSPAAISPVDWTLLITAVDVRDAQPIHAWLERTGPPPRVEFTQSTVPDLTLSIPGTAHSVISVGAVDASDPIMVGDFSSWGPTLDDRPQPDIAAPGVNVIAAKRNTPDDVIVMSGTSMAAPHVAGAIALVFSKCLRTGATLPTSNQIRGAMKSRTKNSIAQWDPGQGYGVIDVEKLLAAF